MNTDCKLNWLSQILSGVLRELVSLYTINQWKTAYTKQVLKNIRNIWT